MKSDMKISPVNIAATSKDTTFTATANSPATVVTAGTVRVNNLANFEYTASLISNGTEIVGISISILLFINLIRGKYKSRRPLLKGITAVLIMLFAANLPGTVNWLIASARDSSCGDFM